MKKPELLLPAGSLERLKTAFLYGADAVYAGMPTVSLRAKSTFTMADLATGIAYAHDAGKKVYLTLNLFTHNKDIPNLTYFVQALNDLHPDGVIVADPGVFGYLKKRCPQIPLHISTQANVCSSLTVQYWQEQGAALVVLGRETPLNEIAQIRKYCPDIKLEMFVHGALCISYSGRCLLSNFMTGRSANKGNCAHACRWHYHVYLAEENRPGELMDLSEDEHGSYILNSKDLCLLDRLNDILPVGLDSFKIEGRNKSEYYVAIAAKAYRQAIDAWFADPTTWSPDVFKRELLTLQCRGYTVGFLDGNAGPEAHNYDVSASTGEWRYTAQVQAVKSDSVILLVKHKITIGTELEFVIPDALSPLRITVAALFDPQTHQPLESISSGRINQMVQLPLSAAQACILKPLMVVRSKNTENV